MDALVPLLKRWPIYKLGLLPDCDEDTCHKEVGTSFGEKYPHANCFHDTCNIILVDEDDDHSRFGFFHQWTITHPNYMKIRSRFTHLYLNYLLNPISSLLDAKRKIQLGSPWRARPDLTNVYSTYTHKEDLSDPIHR